MRSRFEMSFSSGSRSAAGAFPTASACRRSAFAKSGNRSFCSSRRLAYPVSSAPSIASTSSANAVEAGSFSQSLARCSRKYARPRSSALFGTRAPRSAASSRTQRAYADTQTSVSRDSGQSANPPSLRCRPRISREGALGDRVGIRAAAAARSPWRAPAAARAARAGSRAARCTRTGSRRARRATCRDRRGPSTRGAPRDHRRRDRGPRVAPSFSAARCVGLPVERDGLERERRVDASLDLDRVTLGSSSHREAKLGLARPRRAQPKAHLDRRVGRELDIARCGSLHGEPRGRRRDPHAARAKPLLRDDDASVHDVAGAQEARERRPCHELLAHHDLVGAEAVAIVLA